MKGQPGYLWEAGAPCKGRRGGAGHLVGGKEHRWKQGRGFAEH